MNRQEFFSKLQYELRSLSKGEQEKAIFYYREIIDDAIEDGATEEEAIAGLGDVSEIARGIIIEGDKRRMDKMSGSRKALITVLIILGFPIWGSLICVLLALVLVAFILVFVPVLILAVLALGLFAGGIFAIFGTVFLFAGDFAYAVFQLGAGIGVLGLSLLSAVGLYYVFGAVIKACKGLWGFVKRIFSRRVVI